MLLLTTTTDKLQVVSGSAVTVDVHASFLDLDAAGTTVTAGRTNSNITTATTTDIVAAPSSGTRNVKTVNIANKHASSANLVTVQYNQNGTLIVLFTYNLLAGEELQYTEGTGWRVHDVNGNMKTVSNTLSYLKKTIVTASGAGSWTPQASTRIAFVECIGAGGAGGGAATSSSTASIGGGGGGGAYAAKTLSGAGIKVTSYSVGAKGAAGAAGAAGGNGGDTTWDTTVVVAKGGTGGPVLAAAATLGLQVGGAGGASASCTGDIVVSGSIGGAGLRQSGTVAWSGAGGAAAVMGTVGADGVAATSGGAAGTAAAAGAIGSGGGGAATLATAAAGGAGMDGAIIITEYA